MADNPLKRFVPPGARKRLREDLGLAELERRNARLEARVAELTDTVERLETSLHESREETWERSRTRWRAARPDANLTWAADVTGDAFVERAAAHGAFGPGRHVLEIGPGYGRLLAAALASGVEFERYVGVDISAENVRTLGERFADPRVWFVCGDVEQVQLDLQPHTVISSLTFKHLYPSFEGALFNLAPQLAPDALVAFDLIEGRRRYFEDDGVTYIRWYERPEIEQILVRCGLTLEGYDEVRHLPTLTRTLVVARRAAA